MAKEKLELKAIQEAIASSNAGWEAGVTVFSELPEDDKRRLLGYMPGPGSPSLEAQEQECAAAFAKYSAAKAVSSVDGIGAPAAIDWRNNNGNFVTAVRDQKSCGSCVAFGTCASVESQIKILRGASFPIDLSEAHLFFCHARSEGRNCVSGWSPDRALYFFQTQGVTEEAYYPYRDVDQNCTGRLAGWDGHLTKITGYSKINGIEAIKEYVATKGPVEACYTVYDDFFNYKSGVYKHVSGVAKGGHCVCIVGYSASGGYWICKNSWGADFGESGYFRIAFGQCGIEGEVYGPTGIVNNFTLNAVKVQGLWAINEIRNAWVFLSNGYGWQKIGNANEVAFINMLTNLASAKTTNSNVDLFFANGVIQQVYVF